MNPLLILLAIAALFVIAKIFHFVPFGMTTLTEDRAFEEREGKTYLYPVYQASKIYHGALVMLNATGYAVKGATATGQKAAGIALEQVDNLGASGEKYINVKEGTFLFNNSSGGDEITIADIGQSCYTVDDNTVAKTSGTGTRSSAGYVRDVKSDGVWVEIKNTHATDGDLVASNNLGDVGSPATARLNIGANLVALHIEVVTLVGTNVYRVVSPVAGMITKIKSVIDGALTVGDATLTGKIGATPITTGVITITQAGSAAGDVDYCAPTAARTVAENEVISVTVGGTNATATGAKVTILIAT